MTPAQNEESGLLAEDPTPEQSKRSHRSSPDRQDRPLTQRDRVLAMLRDAREVCGSTFYSAYLPRFSVQVHQLRRAGYVISKSPCDLARHDHEGTQWLYRLEAVPDEPHA